LTFFISLSLSFFSFFSRFSIKTHILLSLAYSLA
jgi:hypothetical protein